MFYANALGPMLGRCAHLSRSGMEARLSRYGVTPVQTHVLLYLFRHDGPGASVPGDGVSEGEAVHR